MTTYQHEKIRAEFQFGVEIEGVMAGWFTECNGLSIERDVTPHPEGGINDFVHQLPGRVNHTNITLKRGLVDNILWDWFQQGLHDGQVAPHNVSVISYKPDGTEATRWNLTSAYPAKWSAGAIQSDSNQILIETLELTQNGSASVGGAVSRKMDNNAVQRIIDDLTSPQNSTTDEIDLPVLAEKIYNLLKQELRLEQDRRGRYR